MPAERSCCRGGDPFAWWQHLHRAGYSGPARVPLHDSLPSAVIPSQWSWHFMGLGRRATTACHAKDCSGQWID